MAAQAYRGRIVNQQTGESRLVRIMTSQALSITGRLVDSLSRHSLFQVGVTRHADAVGTIHEQRRLRGMVWTMAARTQPIGDRRMHADGRCASFI